jgi:hypothetical protein
MDDHSESVLGQPNCNGLHRRLFLANIFIVFDHHRFDNIYLRAHGLPQANGEARSRRILGKPQPCRGEPIVSCGLCRRRTSW